MAHAQNAVGKRVKTEGKRAPKLKRARRWACKVCGFLALSEREKFGHLDDNMHDPDHIPGIPRPTLPFDSPKNKTETSRKSVVPERDGIDEFEANILDESDEHEPWNR